MTRFAFVGSRRFPNEELVRHHVQGVWFDSNEHEIVSGGAKGPDAWAEDEANKIGLKTWIFPAKWQEQCHDGCVKWSKNGYAYYPHAGFIRNQLIVDNADVIYAFVMPDRTGGTEDTIKKAMKANKQVVLFYPDYPLD